MRLLVKYENIKFYRKVDGLDVNVMGPIYMDTGGPKCHHAGAVLVIWKIPNKLF